MYLSKQREKQMKNVIEESQKIIDIHNDRLAFIKAEYDNKVLTENMNYKENLVRKLKAEAIITRTEADNKRHRQHIIHNRKMQSNDDN
jgi:hypothetical protein